MYSKSLKNTITANTGLRPDANSKQLITADKFDPVLIQDSVMGELLKGSSEKGLNEQKLINLQQGGSS